MVVVGFIEPHLLAVPRDTRRELSGPDRYLCVGLLKVGIERSHLLVPVLLVLYHQSSVLGTWNSLHPAEKQRWPG